MKIYDNGFINLTDIMNNYKDKNGAFSENLTNDVEEMLDLYEASFLKVPGEVILDDALTFTRACLDDMAKDPQLVENMFSNVIQRTLKQPLRKRLPRLEAVHYIPFYQHQASHNEFFLKLAKLGFDLLTSLHKKELSQLSMYNHITPSLA